MVEATESATFLPYFQINEASVDSGVVPNVSPSVTSVSNYLSPSVTQSQTTSPPVTNVVNPTTSRLSSRPRIILRHLDVYETDLPHSLVNSTCKYPIHPYLTTQNFVSSYEAVVASVSTLVEPTTYAEVNTYEAWQLAMKDEISALESNNT